MKDIALLPGTIATKKSLGRDSVIIIIIVVVFFQYGFICNSISSIILTFSKLLAHKTEAVEL